MSTECHSQNNDILYIYNGRGKEVFFGAYTTLYLELCKWFNIPINLSIYARDIIKVYVCKQFTGKLYILALSAVGIHVFYQ